MIPSPQQFAQLLTEAIHRIRLREGKNVSVVQDELGYALGRTGGSAIEYWRKGHLPPNMSTVAELARHLVNRGGVEQSWLVDFLESAGYPQVVTLCQELWGEQIQEEESRGSIPARAHLQTRPAQQDWGDAPVVAEFHGRQAELTHLSQWLVGDGCQLVTIMGMGGVGKTTLAARLAREVGDNFDGVLWRSLLNAPPLDEILWEWLQFLSGHQLAHLPDSLDERLRLLLDYLRRQRCLLVLDNCEAILQGGEQAGSYRPGYEEYGQLLRWVAEQEHGSSLLLTSRERPRGVARLERESSFVRSLDLAGLTPEAGQALLQDRGLPLAMELGEELVTCYSGNPLALKLVADTIRDFFGGDIAAFLGQETPLFDDIREVLDEQFARLSAVEREIIIWLAIEREPISLQTLENALVQPVSRGALVTAIRALQRRSLLERVQTNNRLNGANQANQEIQFTLQNVVMEYTSDRLIAAVYQEILDEQPAWLNRYALLKAQAKEYIRQSQERLLLQPLARRLLASLGRVCLEAKLKRILDQMRAEAPLAPGHAAGNILNLLLHLGYSLHGYDFSHLAVWQAYLRGIEMHDVDFSNADLTDGVFTNAFGPISRLTSSPDGTFLASTSGDGEIRLWRASEGWLSLTPHQTCTGHTGMVWSVCFSPDGRMIASGSGDRTVRLWDVETGKCLRILQGHSAWVRSVSFSPDGRTLASGCEDQTIRFWDVLTGESLHTLQGHSGAVWSISFSSNGRILASGSEDQTIRVWDVQTGESLHILQGHTNWVWSVSFSPDGQTLASSGDDQTVRLWNMETGKCLHILRGHTDWVWYVCFSPDGRIVASSSGDQTIRLWDVQAGECLNIFHGHTSAVWSLCFSPDGSILTSSSEDHTVRLWDVQTGQCLHILQGYTAWVRSVCFSPDGRTLASSSGDQSIRLWDVQAGASFHILKGHNDWIRSVSFSPNGRMLASGSEDQSVRIWDMQTKQPLHVLQEHTSAVWSVCFSPNSRLLASASGDQTIRLWDVQTGESLHTLHGHTNWVWALCFSPNGRLLASASGDQTIRLWHVETGESLHILQGHSDWIRSLGCSPDGHMLASGSEDQTVRLWDLQTRECLHILQGHTSTIWSICFSPNGRTLASGSEDQTVRLWDLETRECLHILQGHTSWVRSVSFSPDGRTLASGSEDQTVRLWDVQTGELLRSLRSDGPYERMKITGVTGLTTAQKAALRALGAVEDQ